MVFRLSVTITECWKPYSLLIENIYSFDEGNKRWLLLRRTDNSYKNIKYKVTIASK